MNTLLDLFEKKYSKFDGDIRCAGHVLNLSTKVFLNYAFFKKTETRQFVGCLWDIDENYPNLKSFSTRVKSLPHLIRAIVKNSHNKSFLQSTFEKCVENRKLREKDSRGPQILLLDNETRWLSTYKMIDRFIYFREEINYTLERARDLDKREQNNLGLDALEITDLEWDYLKTLHNILGVFYAPTIELQASKKATISLTIPHVQKLLESIKALNNEILQATNPYLAQGLLEAYAKLYEYYPIHDEKCPSMSNFIIATILDPRFNIKYF